MKIKQKSEWTFGRLITAAFPAWLARMNTMNVLINRIKIGLGIAVLTALTGCIGVVGGDGYYDDGGYVGGWWWGGGGRGYDRGHDVHGYSARGAASRGVAHGGGGGHASGGGGHGGDGGRR